MSSDMENNLNNETNAKLIQMKQNGIVHETRIIENEFSPPDGGLRAWLVMIGSFFCNGILFGLINSFSVLYKEFHNNLKQKGSANPSAEAALVGSLAMGTMFLVSAVSGVLTDYIGIRRTTFLGGLIATTGLFISSFCLDNIIALYITFGLMYGLGGALAYTPSLAILGHYFKRHLGIVNGVVTSGSSCFTIVMPYFIDALINTFRIEWTLRVLALMASCIIGVAFLFLPLNTAKKTSKIKWSDAFNQSIWQNNKYIVWSLVIAFCLMGYFVPYVYMLEFVAQNFDNVDGKLPVLCIGITSGIGRLLFGYIGDFPWVNRILLQQIAFMGIGILTILLAFSSNSVAFLIVISLGMGLFDGCFISLLGPIAFDICGRDGATQAIGCLLGICSIPLTIGPYVAGILYEKQHSYNLPLILAGVAPTLGSIMMFATRCVNSKPNYTKSSPSEEPLHNSERTSTPSGRSTGR